MSELPAHGRKQPGESGESGPESIQLGQKSVTAVGFHGSLHSEHATTPGFGVVSGVAIPRRLHPPDFKLTFVKLKLCI